MVYTGAMITRTIHTPTFKASSPTKGRYSCTNACMEETSSPKNIHKKALKQGLTYFSIGEAAVILHTLAHLKSKPQNLLTKALLPVIAGIGAYYHNKVQNDVKNDFKNWSATNEQAGLDKTPSYHNACKIQEFLLINTTQNMVNAIVQDFKKLF